MQSPSRSTREITPYEWFLLAVATVAGVVMAYFLYRAGLVKILTDQNAHLNFSRLTFDSITPGVSQIGFWPPLLHFLLIPFVAVPFLYQSGLAGAFVLIPCLIVCVLFLYRIAYRLTGNTWLASVGALLLVSNPYILYYSATPMMEILYLANLFGATYFMLLWLETPRLRYLLGLGLFVTLTSLSRFEGFVLIPLSIIILFLDQLRRKKGYEELEATLLMFAFLAVAGLVFVVTYSWVYGGNPLAFTGGSWIRDPAADMRPARHNILVALSYVYQASVYMLGTPMVVVSLACFILLMFFSRKRFLEISALLMLASPIMFVIVSMFSGSITINVPAVPPFHIFHNDRYTLTWIGFGILAPILCINGVQSIIRNKALAVLGRSIGIGLLIILILSNTYEFVNAAVFNNFDVIRANINAPVAGQLEVADYLKSNYDYGKILTARVDNDPIIANAGVPLHDYIYEGNYRYFNQAVKEPWLFARYVIMHNAVGKNSSWVETSEPVYRELGKSETFKIYYQLILQNKERKLYKLNTERVLALAKARNYNLSAIPSLNPNIALWEPSSVYKNMQTPVDAPGTTSALLASKAYMKSDLMDFYEKRLMPEYRKGYYVSPQGEGNSESQSYGMLQSLWADDKATFDTIRGWNKRNIQRSDSLFSWQFSIKNGNLQIDDANSATDADTDIAYALLQAADQWTDDAYKKDALAIINSIWNKETKAQGDGRHVLAGPWAANSGSLVLNPSYISPVAYRAFAKVDTAHDWKKVIETSYVDLHASSRRNLPDGTAVFLPPNWITLNATTGAYEPFAQKPDSQDYSYDAFRTFWRVSLDNERHPSEAARMYLMRGRTTFEKEIQNNNTLCSVYFSNGRCEATIGTLAGPLSVWLTADPALATDLVSKQYVDKASLSLSPEATFYEKSWYWFSLWLWSESRNTAVS